MKQKLPGILFLLCIPFSIALFLWITSVTGSEILGLVFAVLLYMLAGVLISVITTKQNGKVINETKKTENSPEEE